MEYIFPLISGVLYGIGGLINKRVTNLVDNPVLSSLLFNIASLVFPVILLAFELSSNTARFSPLLSDWIWIFINSLFAMIAFWGMFRGMRNLPVSEQMLLSRASVLTYTIGGFLIFGERLTTLKLIGLLLVLVGIILSAIRKGKFVFNIWVFVQLFSSVCFGIATILDKLVSHNFSVAAYTFISLLGTTLGLLIWSLVDKSIKDIKTVPSNYILNTIGAGSVMSLAYFLVIKSYELGGLLILTGALLQLKLPIVVIGGYFIFKERSDLLSKFLGVITVLIGLVLLKI